jgi:hypothetical protein
MTKKPKSKAEPKPELDPLLLKFRWDLNAECAFEERMGRSLSTVDLQKASAKELLSITWAGLLRAKPDITPEEAGALVDGENSKEAFTMMFKRMGMARASPKNPEAPATG